MKTLFIDDKGNRNIKFHCKSSYRYLVGMKGLMLIIFLYGGTDINFVLKNLSPEQNCHQHITQRCITLNERFIKHSFGRMRAYQI